MWFVLRAVVVIAAIAFFSPYRGEAEQEASREAGRLAAEAQARLPSPAQVAAGLPDPVRERLAAEAGRALTQGAEAALRGGFVPATTTR